MSVGLLAEGGGRTTHLELDAANFLCVQADTRIGYDLHRERLAGDDRCAGQVQFKLQVTGEDEATALVLRVALSLLQYRRRWQCARHRQLADNDQRQQCQQQTENILPNASWQDVRRGFGRGRQGQCFHQTKKTKVQMPQIRLGGHSMARPAI